MLRNILYYIMLSLLAINVYGQQAISQESTDRLYFEALDHFRKEAYQVTKPLLSRYLSMPGIGYEAEASYYLAYAKLKTGDASGIDELESFIKQESSHPLALTGYFIMGNHFFQQKKFDEALRYYSQVDARSLSVRDQEEFYFKKGYTYFILDRKDAAFEALRKAKDYQFAFYTETSYYLGQLYYERKNYREALSVLLPIDGKEHEFQEHVTALIASCYFYEGNYSELFEYAEERMTRTINVANKTLSRLVGEAYFEQRKFDQAATYLERYVAYSKNKAEAELYYKLAYCYFEAGKNEKAIDNFKLAGLEKGPLGQASSFYLGQLYIRTGNLDYAYSAFRNVIQGSSDQDMKEEAAFLVGKINYQRRQYADAIFDLNAFLADYPKSIWSGEANELLAQAYLNTSNYDQAIEHLEQITNKSVPLKKAYQKVTFQKGQLLFNDSRFQEAARSFERSVNFPIDEEITAEAYYLLGESYSQLENYARAIAAYQNVKRYGSGTWALYADYGLAYVYYNQKNYDFAEDLFEKFVQRVSKASDYFLDAKLRLADCKYVQKKYDHAIRLYDEIKSQTAYQRDYIYYQQGLAYNLKGDHRQAREAFRKAINSSNSSYADNSLFQLGQTYIETGDFRQAVDPLTRLINGYQSSNLVPYARSRRALCYLNLDQLQKASEDYQYILNHNINHPAANGALLGLQEVVRKGGDVPDFERYMDTYQSANPDDGSLEVVAFESAKAKYYNGNYSEAIVALDKFRQKYPNSGFKEDANYFLADAYLRNEDWQKAAKYFMDLARSENSAYFTRALDKAGRALSMAGQHDQAISTYRRLYKQGRSQKDVYNGQRGLMDNYFANGHLDSALYFADEILQSEWKPPTAATEARMIKGKALLQKQNYSAAVDTFLGVINDSKSESSAEAKYLIGKIYYLQQNYKQSLETLFDLNRNYGSYSYWIGRSFLLIADNYLAMEEYLQAKATLQSIVDNATIKEIVDRAREKLRKVESAEEKVLIKDTVKQD